MQRGYRSEYLPFYALASAVEPELDTDQKRPELKGVRYGAREMSDRRKSGREDRNERFPLNFKRK
jgi:hypothetical protein